METIERYHAQDHELPGPMNPSPSALAAVLDMDIPTHILDAVSVASDASLPTRIKARSVSARKASHTPRLPHPYSGQSSAEDVSTTSDSEPDHDYQTDFTTPAASDSNPEDMQPDDVEDFRDREYPQLKGKTYLDHGGTTVRILDMIRCS